VKKLREKEIKRQIWQIIKDELIDLRYFSLDHSLPQDYDKKTPLINYYLEKIQKRINELLEKEQVVLIYKPLKVNKIE